MGLKPESFQQRIHYANHYTVYYPDGLLLGRGDGLMVSVLAFYSDDTSSNPSEVFHFAVKLLVRRTNKQKDAGVSPL